MSDDGSGDQSVSVGDAAEAASPAAAPPLGEVAAEDRAAAPAVPEASVEPVDDWVTELLDRLAAGDKLNASDAARVPYATQLQQQYFVAVQQQKSESAASQLAREAAKGQTELAREAAKGQTEILQQLAAVKRSSMASAYMARFQFSPTILDLRPTQQRRTGRPATTKWIAERMAQRVVLRSR